MIDIFTLRDLIISNMREGTICISFDEDNIRVCTGYKERDLSCTSTDTYRHEAFEVSRKLPEG